MARLSLIPLVAGLVACGPVPHRYDGPSGGSGGVFGDDGDDGVGSDDLGGSEDDDGESDSGGELPPAGGWDEGGEDDGTEPGIATPAFPVPRLECVGAPCFGSDEAVADDLQGSELMRKAYFGVMGYPDKATYGSYNADVSNGPPAAGLLGLSAKSVELVNDLLMEAGIASCEDVPVFGELSLGAAPDVSLAFAPGTHGYTRRVHVTDASGGQAVVEGSCGVQAGFVSLRLVVAEGVYNRIDLAWYGSDDGNFRFELLADSHDGSHTAVRFQTQAPEFGFWLVRADDLHGERYIVHGDTAHGLASVYSQILDADPVWRREGAESFQVAPVAGSTLQCVDVQDEDPLAGTGTTCADLELVDPKPPTADEYGAFSIQWVALPGNGLRDALVEL